MEQKRPPIRYLKHLINFILGLALILTLIQQACEKLPDRPDYQNNPWDPNNPNNMIIEPAMILSPVRMNVESGGEFQLELWLVGANSDSIAGISLRIEFDKTKVRMDSVDFLEENSESFLLKNGGELAYFENIKNDSGFVNLDCAVVKGNPRNVTGFGRVARVYFRHLTGLQTTIYISRYAKIRNSNNKEIILESHRDEAFIGSEIIIK